MNDLDPRHPEAQTMAAFVEGDLAPAEIASLAAHLRDCCDCRTVVAETARFKREEEAVPARHRPAWWLAAAAILAAAVVLIPLWRWNAARHVSPIAGLIEAAPHHRFIESRLSGFPWAELQAPSRGTSLPDPADLKLSGAAGAVLEKTANDHQPDARHAAGVAYLLIDRRADGIAALERAANDSKDARVWSDLAAARYAVATQDERPSQLPLALADADHALRLNPQLSEALFNRALILEHLGILDQARKAWQAYLTVDASSAWSLEARAHLRALESSTRAFEPKMLYSDAPSQLVRAFPQEARTWGEGPMLAAWADAEAANDRVRASTILARIHAIAAALAAFNGERLLGDAVAAIENSTPATRPLLVEAHRLYRDARIAYSKRNAGAAEGMFVHAADLFRQAGSPMAHMATYYAATTSADEHRETYPNETLSGLASLVDASRLRALTAQINSAKAVAANISGHWVDGARFAEMSAMTFRKLGERQNAAYSNAAAAIAFEMTGAADLAWSRRIRSCASLSEPRDRERLCATLRSASIALESIDRMDAAASIIGLAITESRDDQAQLAAALIDRSRLAAQSSDSAAAIVLASSRRAASSIADPGLRETLQASACVAEAILQTHKNPREAIGALARSIAFFRDKHLGRFLPDAYLQQARAFHAAGDDNAAIAAYASGMHEVEVQRNSIRDDNARLRFLDTASQIVEGSIGLYLSRGDVVDALAVTDRTRELRNAAAAWRVPNVPRTAIIEYAVLPHAIAIFCIAGGRVTVQQIRIERNELTERVETFGDSIRHHEPLLQVRAHAGELFDLLVKPVQASLSGSEDIAVVPDRQLYGVPFAALFDQSSQSYLAERFAIRFALSASSVRHETAAPLLRPALVVADPSALRRPRLPEGLKEGDRIAAAYDAKRLFGSDATRSRFLAAAVGSALIHYAGHADSDSADSYGALLLAPSGNDSGVLSSTDIERLKFRNHPLLVLAACSTFRGDSIHVGGMPSLARAFLMAGARGVSGSLWEIDDALASEFYFRFHDQLRAGNSPEHALRAAQIGMIHSSDPRLQHPAAWAPVELLSSF
jgi:CHAT domain-containing protein/tetratricopeptide (TPR) repeat protein